jgi:outer membrane biosynthesis protein TonB
MVAVHREGAGARISIGDAALGGAFAGGTRFAWSPANGFDPALLSAPARLDRIEVAATPGEVSVLLEVPPEISIDVRRYRDGLLLVLREASPAPPEPLVAEAAPRPPPPPAPAPEPEPEPAATPAPPPPPVETVAPTVEPEPVLEEAPAFEPTPEPPPVVETEAPPPPTMVAAAEPPPMDAGAADRPSASTAELAAGLFAAGATTSVASGPSGGETVDELYAQLFPGGAPQTAAETVEPTVETMGAGQGVPFGPFRVRGGVDARYVDADTFIEGPQSAVRDRYLEVVPRIVAEAPLSDGRFEIEYAPALRAFATYDEVNTTSHRLSAGIDLPVGPSVVLYLKDHFVAGTLDTREVDPGGEYFFGLGEFRRNTLDGGASILVAPRFSLELRGLASQVRFQEPSTFFDYDNRLAAAGLGYELTPNLKTTFWYQYDKIPSPDERPEAESTAHNLQVRFTGDILPLLSGELMLGYRDQESPNAGEGGQRFTGFTMGGSLTKRFSRESSATLFVNRSTPASNFENNAFYVFTSVQGSARLPLPLEFQLQGGLGYQWNEYRTVAIEIGAPREDDILAWYVGLRRAILEHLFLSATYRKEERTSNLNRFNTDADGFVLQLEWDIFGNP